MSKKNSNKNQNNNQVISGIYKIENLINHKVYIGQSKDIYKRWYCHKYNTFNEKSKCYNYYIYNAIRKYGIENFLFEIIKETYDLDYWEIFLIQIYKSFDVKYGYNMSEGGHKSPLNNEEVKERAIKNRLISYNNRTDEQKAQTLEKIRKTRSLRTDEDKYKTLMKYRNTMMNKSEEEKINISNKRKQTINNWSDEEKEIHKNIRNKANKLKSKMNILNLNTKEIKSSADWKRNGFILNRNEKHNNFIYNNIKIINCKNNYFCYIDNLTDKDINYLYDNINTIMSEYKIWYSKTRVKGGKIKVVFTKEHKENLKKSRSKQIMPYRTYIMCLETQEIHSVTEWKKLGYHDAYVVANGKQKTNKGLHFKHVYKN